MGFLNRHSYSDRVTIFGESAGAQSVLFHMISPPSHGFFHRVIAQSAPGMSFISMVNPNYTMLTNCRSMQSRLGVRDLQKNYHAKVSVSGNFLNKL